MKDSPFIYGTTVSEYSFTNRELEMEKLRSNLLNGINAEIDKALEELINANTPLYQNETENLSSTQLNLLKAVTMGELQFTSAAVMHKHQLGTPKNVFKNKIHRY